MRFLFSALFGLRLTSCFLLVNWKSVEGYGLSEILESSTMTSEIDAHHNLRKQKFRLPKFNRALDSNEKLTDKEKIALNFSYAENSIVDSIGIDSASIAQDQEVIEKQEDEALSKVKDEGEGKPSRRKFVSYEPSKWEVGWKNAIGDLLKRKLICQALLSGKHQKDMLHRFLSMMCSARAPPPNDSWCYYHDHNHFLWYNSANSKGFELYIDKTPLILDGIEPPIPSIITMMDHEDQWDIVASKFTFLDETTGEIYHEYIEPLVAQLRFPLAECIDRKPLLADFASFVLPPSSLSRTVDGRIIMYDMGSSDWSRLEYIVEEWTAHDAAFTYLITYSPTENEKDDTFLQTVPDHHKFHIYRHYFKLLDQAPEDIDNESSEDSQTSGIFGNSFFLPYKIQNQTRPDDYIMLKLDRMNAHVKQSLVQYFLDHPEVHINELFWEINESDNYVMQEWYDTNLKFDELSSLTLVDAYEILTTFRNRGIRAHAWI
jgi:hypothetical protein